MIPAAFDYVRADSADAAVAALVEHGDEAKLLAGGHSLLPLMKLRLAAPSVLVDIGRLSRPVLHPRRRRPRRHRRPHPPPRPRDERPARHRGAAAARTRPARSATRRCATAAPSAARSPTATRRPTCPRCCSPCGPRSWRRDPTASATIPVDDFFTGFLETALRAHRAAHRDPGAEGRPAPAGRSRSSTAGPRTGPSSASPRPGNGGDAGIGLVNMGSAPLRAAAAEAAAGGRRLGRRRGGGGRRGHRARAPTSTPAPTSAATSPGSSSGEPSPKPPPPSVDFARSRAILRARAR